MHTRLAFALFILVSAVALAFPVFARKQVVGNGHMVETTRSVAPFTSVQIESGIQARIEPGPQGPIALRGDDNILPLLQTEIRGSTLRVGFPPDVSVRPSQAVAVSLRLPRADALAATGGSEIHAAVPASGDLRVTASGGSRIEMTARLRPRQLAIDVSGGSRIEAPSVEAQSVELDGSGGSTVRLSGRAARAAVRLSGAAELEATALAVTDLAVEASGGCRAAIRATGTVRGGLSGGSRVRVARSAQVDVEASGGSRLVRDID